jgi:hypothetical protein
MEQRNKSKSPSKLIYSRTGSRATSPLLSDLIKRTYTSPAGVGANRQAILSECLNNSLKQSHQNAGLLFKSFKHNVSHNKFKLNFRM